MLEQLQYHTHVEHYPISPLAAMVGAKFSITHGLECKKGGLVNQRHDEIKWKPQDFAVRPLIPSVVRYDLQIYPDAEETE